MSQYWNMQVGTGTGACSNIGIQYWSMFHDWNMLHWNMFQDWNMFQAWEMFQGGDMFQDWDMFQGWECPKIGGCSSLEQVQKNADETTT